MIKKLRFLIAVLLCLQLNPLLQAQSLSVNTDGSTAAPTAILDVKSSGKGILIPRMTSSQRNGIILPATGLLVFQTGPDSVGFHYYDGTRWNLLSIATDLYWSKLAATNTIYNQSGTKVGIGTNTAHADLHVSSPSRVLFGQDTTGTGIKFLYNGDKGAVRFGVLTSPNLWDNDSVGLYSFAYGSNTKAKGDYSFAGGISANALGVYSVALGNNNTASGNYSMATGFLTKASGLGSFTTGSTNSASGLYSVAMGLQDTTSGDNSITQGTLNKVTSDNSFSLGYGNKVSGSYSGAIGSYNQVSAINSFAWGTLSRVLGANSMAGGINCLSQSILGSDIALGLNNISTGGYSVSLGSTNTASGEASFAVNLNNSANGRYSFASGYLTQANGERSFTVGSETKADNFVSTAMGYQTIANGKYETVVGLLNDSLVAPNSSDTLLNSPLFIVGNGTNSANRKNAIVVTKEGVTSFAMNPSDSLTDGVLQVKAINTRDNIELYNSLGSNRWGMSVNTNLSFYYNGAFKGSFSTLDGAYTMVSDSRLKKDISWLPDNTLSKIKLLRPASYHYLDNKKEDSYTMGFMAQDFYKIFPELTTFITNRKGEQFYGINYNNVSVLAIKAIQVQQQMIEKLTAEKEELRNKLEDVNARLERIEKVLNK